MVATIFRSEGSTGVHTHVHQLRRYLERTHTAVELVTPFWWSRLLTYPVFAPRPVLARLWPSASVMWYRYWHELFLRNALRAHLAKVGDCVVYAQGPLEAHAALRARRDARQRVVMAVHFRYSQADEHAEPGREIKRDGAAFRAIRRLEREAILQLDGIVYVSQWARDALLSWLPEAAAVPSAVIANFVETLEGACDYTPRADLVTVGKLEPRKNHRFLLEVLAEAKRNGRSLTLDVYGGGPLRKELTQLARALELDDQVRFCGFRSDVREFLPGYKAYAHVAQAETSSLAIIEAMAAGLPVLTADIGPIPELCSEGIEARFWPLDDPVKAAVTLIELIDNEQARLTAGTAARRRFLRDFDADVVGHELRSFLLGTTPRSS